MNHFARQCYDCVSNLIWFPYFAPLKKLWVQLKKAWIFSSPVLTPPPSAVQHECIPQAVLGMDILGQAKSGMGKTAVFVLATLQQIDPIDGQVCV